MNTKHETASTLPVTIRFFLQSLVYSGLAAFVGCCAYLSTFWPPFVLYHNMWLRTVIVDVGLLLTGLLITSGLVAFAEWRPEQRTETEKVKVEIELLEKEKREKSLLQELKARRDSLRDEVSGVLR